MISTFQTWSEGFQQVEHLKMLNTSEIIFLKKIDDWQRENKKIWRLHGLSRTTIWTISSVHCWRQVLKVWVKHQPGMLYLAVFDFRLYTPKYRLRFAILIRTAFDSNWGQHLTWNYVYTHTHIYIYSISVFSFPLFLFLSPPLPPLSIYMYVCVSASVCIYWGTFKYI